MVVLQGPTGGSFRMNEAPLYVVAVKRETLRFRHLSRTRGAIVSLQRRGSVCAYCQKRAGSWMLTQIVNAFTLDDERVGIWAL